MELLNQESREFTANDGTTKTYILSSFPAIAGREIITQYPISASPKIGDYKTNEELMLKLMAYVAVVDANGNPLRLSTRALIDNHVADFEVLVKIEWAMMEKNCSFFANGKASTFFQGLAGKVQALIIKTLTDFSQQSSKKS